MKASIKNTGKSLVLFLALVMGTAITNQVEGSTKPALTVESVKSQPKNTKKNLECLAMNVYKEAGSDSYESKVAVAQVTMNRVEHPSFPKEVCGVVHQKTAYSSKVVCQFSWYCNSSSKAKPVDKEQYKESYDVARKVLLDGVRINALSDALYYHANYVHPRWPHVRIAKVGKHIFYKNRTRKV